MPESGAARAAAENATVDTAANPEVAQRQLNRLYADVEMCRRVVDELGDAPAKVEAKYAKFTKGQDAELREAKKMVAAAKQALKDAEKALKEAG